jgi:hypothetical protein
LGWLMANTQTKFSLAFKQNNEFQKSTPLAADANFICLNPRFLELSLRVPLCPRAPSTTWVPAELRLNRVNLARVAAGDGGHSH